MEDHNNSKVFNIETGQLQITHDCITLDDEINSLEEANLPSLNYPGSSVSPVCAPIPVFSSNSALIPHFSTAECSETSSFGTSLSIQEEKKLSVSEN
ncbi:hypothetical protein O181_104835 [Austropuccinia psidii MF-1]|uniref:Uncharacterized protein n=1 Tax=Austropuccinia psidii MF-1 TaxID=1389203 RepID=A0A9Q3JPC5_9BASI|nr:hypothetical protein [Austropuccinia psidii MF-1]